MNNTITICLHGEQSGIIRLKPMPQGIKIFKKMIPEKSTVYAVCNNTPIPIEKAQIRSINAILVTDDGGNIIMEGQLGTVPRDMSIAKQKLMNFAHKPKISQSTVLSSILEKADSLFGEAKSNTPVYDTVQPQKNTFNPFSGAYPNSVWKKQRLNNGTIYFEGKAQVENTTVLITAVPTSSFSEDFFMKNVFTRIASANDGKTYRLKLTVQR